MTTAHELAQVAIAMQPVPRFRHRGRIARACDCIGFPLVVAWRTGLIVRDFQDYERTPDPAVLLAIVQDRCDAQHRQDFVLPGRLVVLRHHQDGDPMHFGLTIGDGKVLHMEKRVHGRDLRERPELLHSVWLFRGVVT